MIVLELHDDTSHAATVTVDYEYQLEQWLIDIGAELPKIVRATSNDGREWKREGACFVLTARGPNSPTPEDAAAQTKALAQGIAAELVAELGKRTR